MPIASCVVAVFEIGGRTLTQNSLAAWMVRLRHHVGEGMAFNIAIYGWSSFSLPSSIPMSDIEGDTHSNDPASVDYNASAPSWIGETFTFNGGASTLLSIDDDDGNFEDGYVETGGIQTLTQDVTINGTTYAAGSVVENEFSLIDGSGTEIWVVRIDGVNVGFSYPTGQEPAPGDAFVPSVGRDGDAYDSGDNQGSIEAYNAMACFTPGALIVTPTGLRPVETLRVNDLVQTLDGGAQPIRWVSRREVHFGDGVDIAKPIFIPAGALSKGVPHRDMIVSPQHRLMFQHRSGSHVADVFLPAKALTILPGIRTMKRKKKVFYQHFALDQHHVVIADGVLTESCYMGPMVLHDIPYRQRPWVAAIWPRIDFGSGGGYGQTARRTLRLQHARRCLRAGTLEYRPKSQRLGLRTR